MYAFKCRDDSENKLKGVFEHYSKNIKFQEHENSLNIEKYQRECDNFVLKLTKP